MDSSLNEILRRFLQQEKIIDELQKDISANKDQIETQQLKLQEQEFRQSQTIHRQDKTLQRIDSKVEQIDKATMENSDEISRIKQKQEDTIGMCSS